MAASDPAHLPVYLHAVVLRLRVKSAIRRLPDFFLPEKVALRKILPVKPPPFHSLFPPRPSSFVRSVPSPRRELVYWSAAVA